MGQGSQTDHAQNETGAIAKVNRRIVLKASAILASLIAGQGIEHRLTPSASAATKPTVSYDWIEANELGIVGGEAGSDAVVIATHFPFTAVGAHWDGEAGEWPVVELQISYDGETWSDAFHLRASHDGVQSQDGRIFTGLVCATGATHIAYAVYDPDGHRTGVPGFALTYIDASGGPELQAVGAESSAVVRPPQIVTRAEWGADESYRFTESGEWWTLRYEPVRHAIIHHSETSNAERPIDAMRSIYHYHAVTRGWYDIGYNFLVDRNGTIYQGRSGGQNVVAGHAYEYSRGSAGIAFIGNYTFAELSESAVAAMVAIVAWTTRNLDPWGAEDFHDIADLPTICGHRDVLNTSCPGDFAYEELDTIRALVAQTLAVTPDGPQTNLVVGDYIQTTNDFNLRAWAGLDGEVVAQLPAGVHGAIDAGPVTMNGMVWVRIVTDFATGWVVVDSLDHNPPVDWKRGRFGREEFVSLVDSAALRVLPSVNAPLVTMLEAGEEGSILGGPEEADENRWYKVDTDHGEGWIAARFLSSHGYGGMEPSASGGVGGSFDFSAGDQVLIYDGPVNVRAEPGETGAIITSLESGAAGVVLSEPVTASGHVWFQITTGDVTGWVAGAYLMAG